MDEFISNWVTISSHSTFVSRTTVSVNAFSSQSKLQAYLCCLVFPPEKNVELNVKKERYCDIGSSSTKKDFRRPIISIIIKMAGDLRANSDGKLEHREWRVELDGSDRSVANQSNIRGITDSDHHCVWRKKGLKICRYLSMLRPSSCTPAPARCSHRLSCRKPFLS